MTSITPEKLETESASLPSDDAVVVDPQASSTDQIKQAKILIIDDEPLIIRVVRRFLQSNGYVNFVTVTDSRTAIDVMRQEKPDLVLMDIMMPFVSGLEILQEKLHDSELRYLPIIILSATSDKHTKQEALELGATEFLNKPVDPNDLILRVRNALIVKAHQDHLANQTEELERQVRLRTLQLSKSREQVILSLAKAAEFRDNETGRHVARVGKFASLIAEELGFDRLYCSQIQLASQLHDVGKIGIPDSILLNPGKLTDEEFEAMKSHCQIGCHIIDELVEHQPQNRHTSPQSPQEASALADRESILMVLAANIARTHHERWDGTGYPRGISGERIPIEGRINRGGRCL